MLQALGWTMIQLCGDSSLWLFGQEPPLPPGRVGMEEGKAMELLDGFPNSGNSFPALITNLHIPRWFFGASLVVEPPQCRSQTTKHRVPVCVTISPTCGPLRGFSSPPSAFGEGNLLFPSLIPLFPHPVMPMEPKASLLKTSTKPNLPTGSLKSEGNWT